MNRDLFQKQRGEGWRQLERILDHLETRKRPKSKESVGEMPPLYRQVCHDLSLARHRQYGPDLVQRLNHLAWRAHSQLYRSRTGLLRKLSTFVGIEFPRSVRADWLLFVAASCCLYLPGLLMFNLIRRQPELVYSVVDGAQVEAFEQMYDPDSRRLWRERDSDSNVMMFGHYVHNNIGIAFRTFAGGILFGVGSVLILLFNGVVLGSVAGHITVAGFSETFYPFVIGHGALELTAIALSGLAGLKLGLALLSPGRLTRNQALVKAGRQGLPIIIGAGGMAFIAAFIEAFWSASSAIPASVKYGVGTVLWITVFAYFIFAGRGRIAT